MLLHKQQTRNSLTSLNTVLAPQSLQRLPVSSTKREDTDAAGVDTGGCLVAKCHSIESDNCPDSTPCLTQLLLLRSRARGTNTQQQKEPLLLPADFKAHTGAALQALGWECMAFD